MIQALRPAVALTILFTLLTGLAYPLAITGLAALVAPGPAEGSLVTRAGVVVGSGLIGQSFTSDRYFHPRPSATIGTDPQDSTKSVDAPYNAANSSGSNLGPLSKTLIARVRREVDMLRDGEQREIPADLVTTSGSGLDPHISPAAARFQVPRIAKSRGLDERAVSKLLDDHVEGRWLGLVGEPRVNVLLLNLALDDVK